LGPRRLCGLFYFDATRSASFGELGDYMLLPFSLTMTTSPTDGKSDEQRPSDMAQGRDDRRLLRKIDCYLMPLPLHHYTDKMALSSGVVFGLRSDAHLVGQQYAWLSTLFYLGYMLAELPMSFALQRFPLGRFLSLTCSFYSLRYESRFLLGVCEGAVTPGFLMMSACWYKRSEMTTKTLAWMAMNTVFSSFFGLVIYALAKHAQDSGGMAAWRVINLHGFVLVLFLGTPMEVRWLSAEQKQAVQARIALNGNGDGAQREWKWSQVKECFRDPQIWLFIVFNIIATIPSGSLATFGPLVYISFGFTNLETILYALPNSAIALGWFVFAALSIKKIPAFRFPLMAFNKLKWVKWGLYNMTATFTIPTFLAWTLIPLNVAGRTKKTVISASTFISYCAGQMIGTQIFREADAPRYIKGLSIILSSLRRRTCCLDRNNLGHLTIHPQQIIITITWKLYYNFENARRDSAQLAAGVSDQAKEAMNKEAGATDMTDLENRSFRYIC
ncbi:major facilitator superfamily domain-containing protein, partial [Mycena galericulata]